MGAATVVVMYYVGKTCGDWKTGLLASGFTAIVTGQFFYRSFYGYIDHHIAEVLFSTIFCLFYMYALLSEKEQKIDLKDFNTYKKTLLFSVPRRHCIPSWPLCDANNDPVCHDRGDIYGNPVYHRCLPWTDKRISSHNKLESFLLLRLSACCYLVSRIRDWIFPPTRSGISMPISG